MALPQCLILVGVRDWLTGHLPCANQIGLVGSAIHRSRGYKHSRIGTRCAALEDEPVLHRRPTLESPSYWAGQAPIGANVHREVVRFLRISRIDPVRVSTIISQPAYLAFISQAQDSHKRLLWNLNAANSFHPLFAFLLLLQ